jgi:hypothetical protein
VLMFYYGDGLIKFCSIDLIMVTLLIRFDKH